MRFSYKFSNLLGSVYNGGNLIFTPDGNSIISPVGNRITIYDLKNNKTRTLSLESLYNYKAIALSPDGSLLLAVNEIGEAQLISMISCTVIHRHKFQTAPQCVQFSPDSCHFAVAKENHVFLFKAPGEITGEYNPFVLERCFMATYDDITCLDWSSDSRFLAIGCRDKSIKVMAIKFVKNFRTYVLGSHSDSIVSCFFNEGTLDLNTLSKNGQLNIWECSMKMSDITEENYCERGIMQHQLLKKQRTNIDPDEISEDEVENDHEKTEADNSKDIINAVENEIRDENIKEKHPFYYKKISRHFLADEPRKENRDAYLTAAAYNRRTKILVVAFSTGAFYLYELPEVSMIHSLSISNYAISTACFNSTGDWVALGSSALGQLLVWEWQSEQYIMKQQGHSSEMTCISYSPDGHHIASGGEDSKVKIWNTQSGFCFITFNEHTSGVTGVQFSRNKKFLVSSSLDGTVRAFDMTRYRNFRTFTSPRQVQFACVAVDYSGELVVGGGQDVFEIYLWCMKLGTLLEVISGHEGPVTSLTFSPVPTSSILVSGSWDKTIKIWNCLESNSEHETIDLLSDVTCVAFNPNGAEVAVATLNGNISVFDVKTAAQVSLIEGLNDLGSGRSDLDLITAKKNLQGKCFTSIEYSADGECVLAGGKSKNICIYHVREAMLLKKFEITQNHSFDGLDEFISRRHLSEFGNKALIEKRETLEGGNVSIRLPGVLKGDMATRSFKPEVKVFSVRFSPTGQSWAAACTEGLLIYSLDKGIVFDPIDLSIEVTPKTIKELRKKGEYSNALVMALKLNEAPLIALVLESIPFKDISLICASLNSKIAHRLLQTIAQMLESSNHVQFYLHWSHSILTHHGNRDGQFEHQTLLGLHDSVARKYELLSKMCDYNKYTLRVLLSAAQTQNSRGPHVDKANGTTSEDVVDEEMFLISNEDKKADFESNQESSSEEEFESEEA